MTRPEPISSLQNPRVKHVVKLRQQRERRKTGLFIAEGVREVGRAAAFNLAFDAVYHCDSLLPRLPFESPVPTTPVTDKVLEKMAYHREPEGVLAVVHQPPTGWPVLPAIDERTLLLVAVGTEKPGNLGAMARTADAAGCSALIAAGAPVDPFNPNAIRASTCAVYRLPLIADDEPAVLHTLQARGVQIVATSPDATQAHFETPLTGPTAIVIGPEDTGLSEDWLNAAQHRVTIPMADPAGRVADSLNASNAAAVLLFEARRQRLKPTN